MLTKGKGDLAEVITHGDIGLVPYECTLIFLPNEVFVDWGRVLVENNYVTGLEDRIEGGKGVESARVKFTIVIDNDRMLCACLGSRVRYFGTNHQSM
jgi:hypothetical protein